MKNFGFQKMDEMEQQITLRACRAAWVFLVLALFIWEVWELIQGGDTNLPAFLLGAQVVIFCLAQWLGRARVGDDRVKREVVIWMIVTAALVLFGVLLALGVWGTRSRSCARPGACGRRTWPSCWG